jgi:hypothetical protein
LVSGLPLIFIAVQVSHHDAVQTFFFDDEFFVPLASTQNKKFKNWALF